MKNKTLKASAVVLAIAIGSSPVMACNSAPRANTSKGENLVTTVSATPAQTEAPEAKPADEAKTDKAEKPAKTEKAEKTEEVKTPAAGAFTIDNFKIIQTTLEKLGVTPATLENQIKEGKKLVEVLEAAEIPVPKFKKQLYKEYRAAIKEGVKNKQLTKEEGKTLTKAIKQKVDAWMADAK